jgi:hypothetical protein
LGNYSYLVTGCGPLCDSRRPITRISFGESSAEGFASSSAV